MKKSLQLKPLLLSLAVAGSSMAAIAPAAVQAEVSYNAAVSNFYLWRGTDLSNGQGMVSGGADYAHDSGLYAGVWGASEDDGTEFDLYAGYGMTSGDFGLNVAYWAYFYPSDGTKSNFSRADGTLLSEYEVTGSYLDFSLTAMIETQDREDIYYVANYSIGPVGLSAGYYDFDADNADYSHYNISYAATDNLSFTISKAQGSGLADEDKKPLLNVAYSFTF
ncbi:hypothetical protein THMIRHAS_05510 [Thiosulfatimonas sediminis]|uniref:Histidine kinase n=1 Tax=Thiosulfatimonas sediminis TaxID=2675054 RepID=A0A6F8PT39_9GAMM|nr:TorF family putative porin [Thiosulfatimonas sediminis]BBP45178.1 hypothetical protein THMIRHAS_05510 [Thiosulfatimonas sediminis]